MLFDEPTSALDPIATANIEELMSELRNKLTILVVTHNMQQAARVSDYTAYMYLGELIEYGNTDMRSEEHTSELQSLMRISYAVFCLKKKKKINTTTTQQIKQTLSK